MSSDAKSKPGLPRPDDPEAIDGGLNGWSD